MTPTLPADLPRVALVPGPTPLEDPPGLAAALGVAGGVLVKRDDLTGPGLGGNKVRKLEFLLADAREQGCDALVTAGATQSNHCRLTATAGVTHGFAVHLVLGGGVPEAAEGNLLLDRLAGAQCHHVSSEAWEMLDGEHRALVERLEADGTTPYAIPMGGSTPVGAAGYVRAYLELVEQLAGRDVQPTAVVHASSTGGTQAGLLAGRELVRSQSGVRPAPPVVGIDVAKGGGDLRDDIRRLAQETIVRVGGDGGVDPDEVVLVDAPGSYGEVTDEGADAITTGLRSAGLVVDPVYSAKALGALPRLQREGHLGDGPVVYLHTGGQPALFTRGHAAAVVDRGGMP